jgi:hypothetical protein
MFRKLNITPHVFGTSSAPNLFKLELPPHGGWGQIFIDLLYQISPISVKKYGRKCTNKFIPLSRL